MISQINPIPLLANITAIVFKKHTEICVIHTNHSCITSEFEVLGNSYKRSSKKDNCL